MKQSWWRSRKKKAFKQDGESKLVYHKGKGEESESESD
jgi:hypothetical protein